MRKKHLRTDTSKLAQAHPAEAGGDERLGLTTVHEGAIGSDAAEKQSAKEPETPLSRRFSRRVAVEKPVLKNFRLDGADIERLHEIVAAVNRLSAKGTVSENSVLRSLILLGSRTNTEDVFEAVKEILLSRI